MFAKSGKKEIWLGLALEPDCWGNPVIEISWGSLGEDGEAKRRVAIPFEEFIDEEMGQHERGGPDTGGDYDTEVLDIFKRMRRIIKGAMRHVRERNGKG